MFTKSLEESALVTAHGAMLQTVCARMRSGGRICSVSLLGSELDSEARDAGTYEEAVQKVFLSQHPALELLRFFAQFTYETSQYEKLCIFYLTLT